MNPRQIKRANTIVSVSVCYQFYTIADFLSCNQSHFLQTALVVSNFCMFNNH